MTERNDGSPSLHQIRTIGMTRKQLAEMLSGANLLKYCIPSTQSLTACWLFRLSTNSGVLEFASEPCALKGWEEIGVLNVKTIDLVASEVSSSGLQWTCSPMHQFVVSSVDLLAVDAEGITSEVGLVIRAFDGAEVTIAAGVSPGSVSAKVPGGHNRFSPEFGNADYVRLNFLASEAEHLP
jgi:hypothetical protein